MLHLRTFFNVCKNRLFSNTAGLQSKIVEQLKERSLIRVAGVEVSDFIQGLITNDIRHLDDGVGSMYTMFLNTKGRVMYDAIVYRTSENNMFLIECDTNMRESLQKHLKVYRVRRKIDITDMKDEYDVYTVFNPTVTEQVTKPYKKDETIVKDLEGVTIPFFALEETVSLSDISYQTYRDLLIYRDPRSVMLGSRIIAPKKSDITNQIREVFSVNLNPKSECNYRWFRYSLGVGEGINDLPPGNCFPLEANCDYLHGISFHKGCYIGQELTARSHHTGVIRKRLLPLFFNEVPSKFPQENSIVCENVNLGKLRGIEHNAGLGLLRIAQALEMKQFKISDGVAETFKPNWWPVEASKEKISVKKS